MAAEAVALGHKLIRHAELISSRGAGVVPNHDEHLRNGTLDGAFVFDARGALIILV